MQNILAAHGDGHKKMENETSHRPKPQTFSTVANHQSVVWQYKLSHLFLKGYGKEC